MKELKPIMSRIKLLYCVFLLVMVVSVFFNTVDIAHVNNRASFRRSVSGVDFNNDAAGGDFNLTSFVNINFDSISRSSIVTLGVDSVRSKVYVVPSSCDVVIEEWGDDVLTDKQNRIIYIANVALIASWVVYSVFFIIVIFVLGRSVIKQDMFNRLSVRMLRWFAVTLMIFWAASEFYQMADYWVVVDVMNKLGDFAISGYKPNFAFLITALMVYLFAELLALGLRLKEDQDLTI